MLPDPAPMSYTWFLEVQLERSTYTKTYDRSPLPQISFAPLNEHCAIIKVSNIDKEAVASSSWQHSVQ